MKKYTSVWTQISNYFKDYPNNLIFESLNEEGAWDNVWNRYSKSPADGKIKVYTMLNNINQKFVDIVRASGGNNATRCLLIAGYGTDIDLTCDDYFKMPKDSVANKLMISVHYYTPSTFTILEKDADWGKSAYTWGTTAEINQVKTDFNKVKTKFEDKGIPVIIGEYGSTKVNKDEKSVRLYIETVCKSAYDMGFCPMLWDPGTHYSRNDTKFRDSELAAFFLKYKQDTPKPAIKIGDVNGDNTINALDFAAMKSYLLGKTTSFPVENALKVSDVNGDGVFNALDLAVMKQYLLGKITAFPEA
jgi:endoglucanase